MFDNLSYEEQLKAVQDGLKQAKVAIDTILVDPTVQTLKIGILSDLDKPINRIGTLLGNFQLEEIKSELKPVTSFMGVQIHHKQPIVPGSAEPSLSEKEKFLKERDDLYSRITDMSDKEVFMLTREPAGIALIRSVAKFAGHENYRDAEIDVNFLGEIRQMILKTASQSDSIKAAEEGAQKLKEITAAKAESDEDEDEEEGNENTQSDSIKAAEEKNTKNSNRKKK